MRPTKWMLAALVGAVLTASPATAAPADPVQAGQWALGYLQVDKVWPITRGVGVTVAVLDTGVNADDPDLAGQVIAGGDYGNGQSNNGLRDIDKDLHGTSMASIIAGSGNNGNGMMGLAPGSKILSVGIGENNQGNEGDVAGQAILEAVKRGARVINLSFGSGTSNPVEHAAIEYAISQGVVVVAAAGNEAQTGNPVEYPAADPGVIAVTEIDSSGNIPAEAEHGPQVILAAPGYGVTQLAPGGGYMTWHGTSNASAYVSACAALLLSHDPSLTAPQVADLLIHTAHNPTGAQRDPHYGFGIVDPYAALTTTYRPPANANPLGAELNAPNPDSSANANDGWGGGSGTSQGPTTSAAPVPSASSGSGSGISPLWYVLAGVGGVLVIAGGTGMLLRRRRHSVAPAAAPPWGDTPPGSFGAPPPHVPPPPPPGRFGGPGT